MRVRPPREPRAHPHWMGPLICTSGPRTAQPELLRCLRRQGRPGDLINLPNLRIGFYSLCLWNESAGHLQCHKLTELESLGLPWGALVLAQVGVYGALVFTLFVPLSLLVAHCHRSEDEWHLAVYFLVIASVLLPGGLGIFLTYTWRWITISLLGPGFLALAAAEALLVLLLMATVMFPKNAEDDKSEQKRH